MKGLELWLCDYLLNSLWQVPLLFAAAWLVARTIPSAAVRTQHRVWVGVLALQALLPGFRVDFWALWMAMKKLVQWGWGGPAVGGHIDVTIGAGTSSNIGVLCLQENVLLGIAALYLGCVMYFAGRLVWGIWKTTVMRREAEPARLTGEFARVGMRLREFFSLTGGVEGETLAVSRIISGPVTVGVTRQVLLVPPDFLEGVSESEMEAVLAHEFAHMRRRDFAKNLLYEALSLPVDYHPFLWLTRLRLAESREMVCDRMAADAVRGRERYVRSLLRLASMLSDRPPTRILHVIGIFDANTFERRVMNLTKRSTEVQGVRRLAMVAACVAIGAATCVSALALRMGVTAGAAQDQASKSLSVNGKVMEGNLIVKTTPVYPAEAKANKDTVDGPVVLSVLISKEGVPVRMVVKQSLRADYDRSAIDAVQQWRWKPYLLNGNPTAVKTTITVNYSLAN